MKKSFHSFAKYASFSLTILASQMALAQVAEPAKSETTDPKEVPVQTPQTPVNTTSSLNSSNIFSNTTSVSQQSFTPSYELSGGQIGTGQAGLMTAAAKGAPIVSGGLYIYLSSALIIGRNDNVIGSANNAISSPVYSLQPEVVAELKNHGDRYTLDYIGNYTRFADSSNDNFNHHEFKLAGDNIFDARTRLGWLAGYIKSTDPRGSTDRGLSADPDQWHAPTLAGILSYGATGATGRFEFDGSLQNKRYDNNRTTTIGSDVDLSTVSARFFYRIAPKTSLLFETKQIKSDYVLSTSTNSNTDRRLMVGATWDATAATTGIFKVGYLKKNFDSSARTDYSGLAWEGQVRWMPLTYSTVDFVTSKTPSDSTGVGDYIMNKNYNIAWTHKWTSTVGSRVNVGLVKSDFINGARQDDLRNYGLGLTYDLRRWLRLSAEITNTNRSSTIPSNDFKRNVMLFSVEGTL